ncbi:hypothetical protein MKW98_013726 [Papaver atlanticum]|uniref:Large ribosomal subunit protein uL15/eL18 domain-containing protein n=1 Tax=Papaver atlanticum TaxID=357466 RepID=A0AAD4SDS5_9MAGN|nr:hypothetical protein MKW98_013726 [Papaver atlanticum]
MVQEQRWGRLYRLELSAGVNSINQFGSPVCSLKFRDNGTDLWAIAQLLGSELRPSIHGCMELQSELIKLRNCSQWWQCKVRIEKAGGECVTFDQLALKAPLGQNTNFVMAIIPCGSTWAPQCENEVLLVR